MPILGLAPSSTQSYPPHFDIEKVIRPNILTLHPYRCARDDYSEGILLDANENALGSSIAGTSSKAATKEHANGDAHPLVSLDDTPDFTSLRLHRYPDPAQLEIKRRIAALRGVPDPSYVFLGVGSDEVIDLLMRVCVAPGREKVLITPPTYGMYAVCAQVNDLGVVKVPLDVEGGKFAVRVDAVKRTIDADPTIKLIFLCSPGNPTGTLVPVSVVQELLDYPTFKGIVVVDEAYIDFAGESSSAVQLVARYANLVVMQTLSKSFGLAAIRLGIALAQPPLVQILSNTKAPYNISTPTAHLALAALSPPSLASMHAKVATLVSQRSVLLRALESLAPLGLAPSIGANDANFVLVPVLAREPGPDGVRRPDNARAQRAYRAMAEEEGVVVRYRGSEYGCEGCLRITVGTEDENRVVVQKLKEVLKRL